MNANISGNDFVKMRVGKIRLLFPATELLSIEAAEQISPASQEGTDVATITINNHELPVYVTDDNLIITPYLGEIRSCCLCLDDGQHRFGIVCDEAHVIDSSVLIHHNLPGCMGPARDLIHGLAVNGETVFCKTDSASLFKLIG